MSGSRDQLGWLVRTRFKMDPKGSGTVGDQPQEPGSSLNAIGRDLLDAAIEVHRELCPGLLERTYPVCLIRALEARGRTVEPEVPVGVTFRGEQLDGGFRIDLLVEDQVAVELKAVEGIAPVHEAQLLAYLKLAGHQLGYLVNFNRTRLIQGFHRFVLSPHHA